MSAPRPGTDPSCTHREALLASAARVLELRGTAQLRITIRSPALGTAGCVIVQGVPPVPEASSEADGGKKLAAIKLTHVGCARDIVRLLATSTRRLQATEITAALEAEGHRWGDSTVANTLAELTRSGILDNLRAAGGYAIPSGDE